MTAILTDNLTDILISGQ